MKMCVNWAACTNPCNGIGLTCTNLGPNTCCGLAYKFDYFELRAVPAEWNIQVLSYKGDRCERRVETYASEGRRSFCMKKYGGEYSGAGYGFINKKRGGELAAEAAAEVCATNANCQSWQKPDVMAFVDGSELDITGLDGSDVDKL